VADALRRRRALRFTRELDLHAGRLADRAEVVFEVHDLRARKLESGAVELYVVVRNLPALRELVGARLQWARDRRDVLGILREVALRDLAGGEHAADRVCARSRVETLTRRRREDDAQGGALLAAELRIDQVGRLLRVRPGDLEVVDEMAVECGVQADQHDEDRDPPENDTPRMTCAGAGD